MTSLVAELRDEALALLQEEGLAGTLKVVTSTESPDGLSTVDSAVTTDVLVVPFSSKALTPGESKRTERAKTVIAAKQLAAPPEPLSSSVVVGSKEWLLTKIDTLPDDGTGTAAGVAIFDVEMER